MYILRVISTFHLISSARLESRVPKQMKIVAPQPGIKPGPYIYRAGVQPLRYGGNFHTEHIYIYIYDAIINV